MTEIPSKETRRQRNAASWGSANRTLGFAVIMCGSPLNRGTFGGSVVACMLPLRAKGPGALSVADGNTC